MATVTRLVTFADGRTMRLTIGEVNAINAFIEKNGKDGEGPERTQYAPDYVKFTTIRNLVDKGIMEHHGMGCVRFCEGVLDISVQG